jgi:hypothetical protein
MIKRFLLTEHSRTRPAKLQSEPRTNTPDVPTFPQQPTLGMFTEGETLWELMPW